MPPLDVALDHYRDRQSLVEAASTVAGQMWDEVNPARIADSWVGLLPEILTVTSGAQLGAARRADDYTTAVLDAQDVDAAAVAEVNPRGFSGVASDGRGLASLLRNPVVVTLLSIQDGLDVVRALGMGRANLDMLVRTQVADAGRLADQVALNTRPKATGYVRLAVGTSCARCLLLSGKFYSSSTGFQRHPRCDCIHIPASNAAHAKIPSPEARYARLSTAERTRAGFTRADQRAIAEGADLGQVVNAHRGMYTAGGRKFTTEGTTKRGFAGSRLKGRPRLSVDQIFRDATDRDDALRLLERNGYTTGRPRPTATPEVSRIEATPPAPGTPATPGPAQPTPGALTKRQARPPRVIRTEGLGPQARLRAHLEVVNEVPESLLNGVRESVAVELAHQAAITPRSALHLVSVSIPEGAAAESEWLLAHKPTTGAVYHFEPAAMELSPLWRSQYDEMHNLTGRGIEIGWLTPGHSTDAVRVVVAHEYGHHLARVIKWSNSAHRFGANEIEQLFVPLAKELGVPAPELRQNPLSPMTPLTSWMHDIRVIQAIEAQVSGYAVKSYEELIAEIWAEYSGLGAEARPLQRRIGAIMRQMAEDLSK